MDIALFHNLHGAAEVRAFPVPHEGIRRWDETALVYDVAVRPNQMLRHYGFPQRWFEVNVSMDFAGRLVTEPGPVDWSFNCDICTPVFTIGPHAYNVDLELDVLVAPDGHAHVVIDEDDFAVACHQGLFTAQEQDGARAGLADLLGLIQSGTFLDFLHEICPLANIPVPPEQPRPHILPLSAAPVLQQQERHRYFGRRLNG